MNWNWSYSPETPNLGQMRRFLAPCELQIWRMTLKNHRASLRSSIKLYVSFHHHMWTQTAVTVRKRLSWVVMMIRWWEHSQKGVIDGSTDRRTENTIHRTAWSQLKMWPCVSMWSHNILSEPGRVMVMFQWHCMDHQWLTIKLISIVSYTMIKNNSCCIQGMNTGF